MSAPVAFAAATNTRTYTPHPPTRRLLSEFKEAAHEGEIG
jgi:hypothetical protein